MLKTLRMSHLALPSRDPQSLANWYVENFGFQAKGLYLWSDGTVLSLIKGEPLPNEHWHFGFRLDRPEELTEWRQQMSNRGLEPTAINQFGEYRSFYVRDPEGNDVEFFFDQVPETV